MDKSPARYCSLGGLALMRRQDALGNRKEQPVPHPATHWLRQLVQLKRILGQPGLALLIVGLRYNANDRHLHALGPVRQDPWMAVVAREPSLGRPAVRRVQSLRHPRSPVQMTPTDHG